MAGLDDERLAQRRKAATAQQDAVIAAAEARAIIACPGAGKTRTIVERHCVTPRNQAVGRAIVSFTKVAAAQVRSRATKLGRPDLLQHPHAITTLDGFFWRFLVRPFLPAPADSNGVPFRRLETWRDAPRDLRLINYWGDRDMPLQFDLADFQFRFPGGTAPPAATLTGPARYEGVRRQLSDREIADVCRRAEQHRTKLANDHHLLTGEETRRLGTQNLRKYRDLLARTLTGRFRELVVDEAQDCSDVDVDLLLSVEGLGIPMMAVGDPDQAIYSFRTSTGPSVDRLLTRAPVLELTGNWRSSDPICRLAATLRTSSRHQPDNALTVRIDGDLPIYLLSLDDGRELTAFDELATQAKIPPAGRFVLAHGSATLPGSGGRRPPANLTKSLVWAVNVLRQPAREQKTRDLAEQILQAAIVRFWLPGADSVAAEDRQATWGTDRYHLRRLAATALVQLPDLTEPAKQWCATARQVFASLNPTTAREPKGTTIQCPQGQGTKPASSLSGLGRAPVDPVAFRTDTIHGVKGEESDAVLVLLPDDERTTCLVARWTRADTDSDQETDEALRVLYVAVTRARQLVALALPQQHIPAIAAMLNEFDVLVQAPI